MCGILPIQEVGKMTFGERVKERRIKCYVGLFHMFTDQRYFEAVKNAVGEQIYKEVYTA